MDPTESCHAEFFSWSCFLLYKTNPLLSVPCQPPDQLTNPVRNQRHHRHQEKYQQDHSEFQCLHIQKVLTDQQPQDKDHLHAVGNDLSEFCHRRIHFLKSRHIVPASHQHTGRTQHIVGMINIGTDQHYGKYTGCKYSVPWAPHS